MKIERRMITGAYVGATLSAALFAWCAKETPGLCITFMNLAFGVIAYQAWAQSRRSFCVLLAFIAGCILAVAPTRLLAIAVRNLEGGTSYYLDRIALGTMAFFLCLAVAFASLCVFRGTGSTATDR